MINYQIMTEEQKNKYGKYIPNWDIMISDASCEEEIAYIREVMARFERWSKQSFFKSTVGFAFNMVYITRQKCGHFEIFQCPANEYHIISNNLEQAREHAEISNCSSCICGRSR